MAAAALRACRDPVAHLRKTVLDSRHAGSRAAQRRLFDQRSADVSDQAAAKPNRYGVSVPKYLPAAHTSIPAITDA